MALTRKYLAGRINSLGGEGLGEDRRDRHVFFRAYNTQTAAAVERDVLALVGLLAEAGVDVDAASGNGDTALHAAALGGLNQVIRLLVERGATVDAPNAKGQTPLAVAEAPRRNRGGDVFEGQPETVALLRALSRAR